MFHILITASFIVTLFTSLFTGNTPAISPQHGASHKNTIYDDHISGEVTEVREYVNCQLSGKRSTIFSE